MKEKLYNNLCEIVFGEERVGENNRISQIVLPLEKCDRCFYHVPIGSRSYCVRPKYLTIK